MASRIGVFPFIIQKKETILHSFTNNFKVKVVYHTGNAYSNLKQNPQVWHIIIVLN